jgi:hypothetical protein
VQVVSGEAKGGAEMSEWLDSFQKLIEMESEMQAYEYVASLRWPDGPQCRYCDGKKMYKLRSVKAQRLYKCSLCRKQTSVTAGTMFEDSHIPLRQWLFIMWLACHPDGISARQVQHLTGMTYKSAWHAVERLRRTMEIDCARAKDAVCVGHSHARPSANDRDGSCTMRGPAT